MLLIAIRKNTVLFLIIICEVVYSSFHLVGFLERSSYGITVEC